MANRISGTISTAQTKKETPSWHEREKAQRIKRLHEVAARISETKTALRALWSASAVRSPLGGTPVKLPQG